MAVPSELATAWAASGAMALTGRSDGPPLVAPDDVVQRMQALGAGIGVDVLPLLGERAAALRLSRLGDTSCGRAARLLPCADGWLAVNLPRDDDLAAIPAWLEAGEAGPFPWDHVRRTIATRPAGELVERAALLALPVGAVGEARDRSPVVTEELGGQGVVTGPPFVVDLTSLWAGPLCARLLADRGARVVKVESVDRLDGARLGPRAFYDRLHGGTESVTIDLGRPEGRSDLEQLLRRADVVLEGSRPRALQQLGIDARSLVDGAIGAKVWVSITGHGRPADRVAFGDDAAAAGGLVAWPEDERGPCFVADAVADPLTGVAAAAAAVAALEQGGRHLVDVSMAAVAASVVTDPAAPWRADPRLVARMPTLDPFWPRAPGPGEHDERVRRQ